MVDPGYSVHTESNGAFAAEFNTAGPNTITRGGTATFTFETELGSGTPDLVVESNSSKTIPSGTTESYAEVIIKSGGTIVIEADATLRCNSLTNDGTLTNNGTLTIQEGLVSSGAVLEFFEWAGRYATVETHTGTLHYHDQIPSTLDISSLAVGVEPSPDLQSKNARGVWGLVRSVRDDRDPSLSTDRYTFEVEVLAPYTRYANHSELANDLQITL